MVLMYHSAAVQFGNVHTNFEVHESSAFTARIRAFQIFTPWRAVTPNAPLHFFAPFRATAAPALRRAIRIFKRRATAASVNITISVFFCSRNKASIERRLLVGKN